MGIQRFGARMKDHATRNTLGSTESPAQHSIAIIDGPGLAHYIYYKLCDGHTTTSEGIKYSDCDAATITWLDDLRSIGYKVEAILFDGALPTAKKDVRLGRLQSYIGRVQAYRQSIGNGAPTMSGQARKNLPPPSFLVFSVVEELLQSSEYANVTYVVPGEADPYCIAAAQSVSQNDRDVAITIFSDDSDLLVYEVGKNTSVTPFRDLSESKPTFGVAWTGEQYWPAQIAQRAAKPLQGLIKPAFFMAQDQYCTFENALRMSAASDFTQQKEFAAFARTFETTNEVNEWAGIKSNSAKKDAMAACDSRVSELIHQLRSSKPEDAEGAARMYLPFLTDDPSRATAWNIGHDIRTLSYSILLQGFRSSSIIQEYRRSGSRIVATLLEMIPSDELEEQIASLTDFITKLMLWAAESTKLRESDAWRYLVMQHTLRHLQAEGYTLPSFGDVLHVLLNRAGRKWHLIQLSAQYQASFYSFRILKQIIAHTATHDCEAPDTMVEDQLQGQLNSLPRIAGFFKEGELSPAKEDESKWSEPIITLLETLGGDEADAVPSKKRKRAKKAKEKQPNGSILTQNPFAMLAD